MSQVFPDLVPRQKWKLPHCDIEVGDIGLIKYEKKLGPDAWRMAMVAEVLPGEDRQVRTIHVEFRTRHVKDQGKPYCSKDPLQMEIRVQRYAMMLPKSEQDAHENTQPSEQGEEGPGMAIFSINIEISPYH